MGSMFTATPPSVHRRRSGGGRRSLGDKEQLPFVATRSSYSYGSQFSNMPKPPQLAETKVPLSVALKQQQEAAEARMKAEQMERDRIVREQGTAEPEDHRRSDPNKVVPDKRLQESDPMEATLAQQRTGSLRSRSIASEEPTAGVSSSMPPPPRRRSPRLRSEASDHSYSFGFDSTLGMSRSYASEDDVGGVLGRKFTQNLADLPSDSATDEDEPTEDVWSSASLRGGSGRPDVDSSEEEAVEQEEEVEEVVEEVEDGPPVPAPAAGAVPLDEAQVDNNQDFGPPTNFGWDWVFWHYNNWMKAAIIKYAYSIGVVFVVINVYVSLFAYFYDVDFRTLKPSPFTYTPPSEPPKNLAEVVARMQQVEGAMHEFGIHQTREQLKYQDTISDEVSLLSKSIKNVIKDSEANADSITAAELQLADFNKRFQDLETWKKYVNDELSQVRTKQADLTAEFLEAVPLKVVAEKLPDGSVKLSSEFQASLKEYYKQVYPPFGLPRADRTGSDILHSIPDWQTFLRNNEQNLRDLVDEHTGIALDGKGGYAISKGTIAHLVQQKVKEFDTWEKEQFWPQVDSTIVQKVKAEVAQRNPRTQTSIGLSDRQNQQDRTESRPDRRSLPDYASLLTGGKITPFITSPSYDWTTSKARWFYSLFGKPRGIDPQPTIAITPTNDVGQCWPFAGDTGSVGIKLSAPIFINQISVEHVARHQAIDISSAPRRMEFWAEFQDQETRDRVEAAAAGASNEIEHSRTRFWDREAAGGPNGPTGDTFDNFVKLHSFKYDIARGHPRVQTFDIPVDLMNLNVTARVVAFKVINNWGHPNFTCLYRVRVHGTPQHRLEELEEEDLERGKKRKYINYD